MSNIKSVFKVIFHNQGKVYELYARSLDQSGMLGFVVVEELIFGERSGVLVDPSEEKLAAEFTGVKRTFIPMHSIIRIDEVEKEGVNKIHDQSSSDSKVTAFPTSLHTPPRS